MSEEKTRIVMRAFVISQFSYCPLIWKFHERGVKWKINHINERPLRIAYQDFTSSFAELIINDNSLSTKSTVACNRNYRTKVNLNPFFMKELFLEREIHYNLRVMNSICARKLRTTTYGKFPTAISLARLTIAYKDVPIYETF